MHITCLHSVTKLPSLKENLEHDPVAENEVLMIDPCSPLSRVKHIRETAGESREPSFHHMRSQMLTQSSQEEGLSLIHKIEAGRHGGDPF